MCITPLCCHLSLLPLLPCHHIYCTSKCTPSHHYHHCWHVAMVCIMLSYVVVVIGHWHHSAGVVEPNDTLLLLPCVGGMMAVVIEKGGSLLDPWYYCGVEKFCQVQGNSGLRGQGWKGSSWPRLGITPGVQETDWVQWQRSSIDPLHRFQSD